MSEPLQIVVAFGSLESRRHVTTILVNLGLDPICISSVVQCRELLSKEDIDLIFCDRFLSDGDYCDVLSATHSGKSQPFVVLACQHNNSDYQQAIAQGVFAVTTAPCHPTDVEWMLIQAKRKQWVLARPVHTRNHGASELIPARKMFAKNTA
jgi:DNA-binding NtrC family response regulator